MSIDGYLAFEDGVVSLGGQALPGVLISLSVEGSVRFDQAKQDGLSGTAKTPLGWEDAAITATMDLLSDETSDCYKKLAGLNRTFKGADNGANPKVYTVTGRHLRARGVDQVIFSYLESEEDDQTDTLRVRMNFTEHKPAIVRRETQVAAAGAGGKAPVVTAMPAHSPAILADDDSPFMAGFKKGLG